MLESTSRRARYALAMVGVMVALAAFGAVLVRCVVTKARAHQTFQEFRWNATVVASTEPGVATGRRCKVGAVVQARPSHTTADAVTLQFVFCEPKVLYTPYSVPHPAGSSVSSATRPTANAPFDVRFESDPGDEVAVKMDSALHEALVERTAAPAFRVELTLDDALVGPPDLP